jgi:hypothetical protein
MLKKITIINNIDAAPVGEFNGVDAGVIFERRVKAAAKHFNIEVPHGFNFNKPGAYLIGNENDLYCISITDANESEAIERVLETAPIETGKATFDIEFTDTEEKGLLIDLIRQAICDVTGNEMKGATLASFESFINKNESLINSIVGQTKVNTFAIPQEINAQLIQQDIESGLRPAPKAKAKRVRTKKATI